MSEKKFTPKLVRDNIPDILRAQGMEPVIRVLTPEEMSAALDDKAIEENNEYLAATSPAEKFAELQDILEVTLARAILLGYTLEELLDAAAKKREVRGGFTKNYFSMGAKGD